jgi:hypothetical protein
MSTRVRCEAKDPATCSYHNPHAKTAPSFRSPNDVFARLASEAHARQAKAPKRPTPKPNAFQRIDEKRTLPKGIPAKIADHVQQSQENASHLSHHQQVALSAYASLTAAICNNVLRADEDYDYEYYTKAPNWREADPRPCDFNKREDLVDFMETLDSALSQRQEESRVVYRGIPLYSDLHDKIGQSVGIEDIDVRDTDGLVRGLKEYYKPGTVFNEKTYLSTTSSAYYAADRSDNTYDTKQNYYDKAEISGIVFEMKTNAGVDITGVKYSRNAYEREVVLPRDMKFKVTNVYVRPESYNTESGYDNKWDKDTLLAEDYTKLAAVVQMVEVDDDGNEITHTRPHQPRVSIEDTVKTNSIYRS